jgi:hypothetical protein
MKRVLLISKIPPNNATTIDDHVNALVEFSVFDVINMDVNNPGISHEISVADCIILHYSAISYPYRGDETINSFLRLQISLSDKPILCIVQDEQRNVLERFRYFETLGVKHVFSVANEAIFNLMYPLNSRNFSVSRLLTGYMPLNLDNFLVKDWEERKIDISYRARRLPLWYGNLGHVKSDISDRLNDSKASRSIKIDASCEEEDRLYGQDWIDFLCDSKVAVGTESGSSTLDMDGRFHEEWQSKSRLGTFELVEPLDANYAAISPRIFEYAAAKSLLALTPGEYSGILVAGTHYFELNPDLSNLGDLVALMGDVEKRENLINNAYSDLIASNKYGYGQMVREIDNRINSFFKDSEGLLIAQGKGLLSEQEITASKQIRGSQESFHFQYSFKNLVKYGYQKVMFWGLSRKGILRLIIRRLYRIYKRLVLSKLMIFLRLLTSSKVNFRKHFKLIHSITGSLSRSLRIILELEFLREEAENLTLQGCSLSIYESNSAIWISWPDVLDRQHTLKMHPKLDGFLLPDFQGVWLTRSDFSEVGQPLRLSSLSNYYVKSKPETLELLQIFTTPFNE